MLFSTLVSVTECIYAKSLFMDRGKCVANTPKPIPVKLENRLIK